MTDTRKAGHGFLEDRPAGASATILLAHGAGAPMDTSWMNGIVAALVRRGLAVVRFEFSYMAARRSGGTRKPPPRAETLMAEFRDAIAALDCETPLVIGGKSMGGRVASMIADQCRQEGQASGLVCLGYPFHPPGRPASLRTAHLESLETPALICQGTRDPFGTREDVTGYRLSGTISLHWLEDGDHDFKPRKASGLTLDDHIESVADAIAGFVDAL